jgi:hypothetical protein
MKNIIFFRKSGIAAGIISVICVIHGPANAYLDATALTPRWEGLPWKT